MIPKHAHFFWSGDSMSYFRYVTLESFRHWHPNWVIWLWSTDKWATANWRFEKQDFHHSTGENYMQSAIALVDRVISYDKHPNVAPNYQSDFMRWDSLYEHGGFYLDLDQLIVGSFDEFTDWNTGFIYTRYGGMYDYSPVGCIAAAPGVKAVDYVRKRLSRAYNAADYSSIGPHMFFHRLADLRASGLLNECNAINVGSKYFYSIPFSELAHTLYTGGHKVGPEAKAIHWFGGHPDSQAFNKKFTPESAKYSGDTISRELRKMGLVTPEASQTDFAFGKRHKSAGPEMVFYYSDMQLHPSGEVRGYDNVNERWWGGSSSAGFVNLFHENGLISTKCKHDAVYGYSGKSNINEETTHMLTPLLDIEPVYVISSAQTEKHTELALAMRDELLGRGVDADRVLIARGGLDKQAELTFDLVEENNWLTTHTGFEYAALHFIARVCRLKTGFVFLLHDTMELGDRFIERTSRIPNVKDVDIVYAAMNIEGHTCGWHNCGFYSIEFLRRIEQQLAAMHGISRRRGIEIEVDENQRGLWRLARRVVSMPNAYSYINESAPVAYHGVKRCQRFIPAADLVKYYTPPQQEDSFIG
jgi:hypothetical protein